MDGDSGVRADRIAAEGRVRPRVPFPHHPRHGPAQAGPLNRVATGMPVSRLAALFVRAGDSLLPPRCLLCGAPGAGVDLCPACIADLPRNAVCCTRCALPLAHPAARCGACLRRPPPWERAWAPFRYAWPLDRLAARHKFAGALAAGRTLARIWSAQSPPTHPDLLVPVPLHRGRLRRRGYNQSLELARVLAARHGIDWRADVLRRRRPTRAQTELDAASRHRNVRGAFAAVLADPPAHVAVVDDVMTTGATMAECARVLRRAGVARVDAWALARAPAPRR